MQIPSITGMFSNLPQKLSQACRVITFSHAMFLKQTNTYFVQAVGMTFIKLLKQELTLLQLARRKVERFYNSN